MIVYNGLQGIVEHFLKQKSFLNFNRSSKILEHVWWEESSIVIFKGINVKKVNFIV